MKTAKFNKPLTIALSSEVYDEIKTITDELQISMAEWVRAAVQGALVDNKKRDSEKDEKEGHEDVLD